MTWPQWTATEWTEWKWPKRKLSNGRSIKLGENNQMIRWVQMARMVNCLNSLYQINTSSPFNQTEAWSWHFFVSLLFDSLTTVELFFFFITKCTPIRVWPHWSIYLYAFECVTPCTAIAAINFIIKYDLLVSVILLYSEFCNDTASMATANNSNILCGLWDSVRAFDACLCLCLCLLNEHCVRMKWIILRLHKASIQ